MFTSTEIKNISLRRGVQKRSEKLQFLKNIQSVQLTALFNLFFSNMDSTLFQYYPELSNGSELFSNLSSPISVSDDTIMDSEPWPKEPLDFISSPIESDEKGICEETVAEATPAIIQTVEFSPVKVQYVLHITNLDKEDANPQAFRFEIRTGGGMVFRFNALVESRKNIAKVKFQKNYCRQNQMFSNIGQGMNIIIEDVSSASSVGFVGIFKYPSFNSPSLALVDNVNYRIVLLQKETMDIPDLKIVCENQKIQIRLHRVC